MYVYQVLWTVVTSLAVILHTVALYFLIKSYKGNTRTCQHTFLINLSAAELFKNLELLVVHVMRLVEDYGDLTRETEEATDEAAQYLTYMSATSSTYCYFFAMFLLTGDRLCAVLLLHRYRAICTVRRATILIAVTWFLCYCVNLPVSTYYYFTFGWLWLRYSKEGEVISSTQLYYIPLILSIGFVIFGCITYTILFTVYAKSRRRTQGTPESLFRTFVNSSFYISVLLITSFLILYVTPTLVNSYYTIREMQPPEVVYSYAYTSLYVSDLVDAIIYVFLYKPVRDLLKMKLACFRRMIQRMQRPADGADVHRFDRQCQDSSTNTEPKIVESIAGATDNDAYVGKNRFVA